MRNDFLFTVFIIVVAGLSLLFRSWRMQENEADFCPEGAAKYSISENFVGMKGGKTMAYSIQRDCVRHDMLKDAAPTAETKKT